MLTVEQAQERLGPPISQAVYGHKPTIILRSDGEQAVLISATDYNDLQHLRSEAEARQARAQIAARRSGGAKTKRLIDIEDDLLAAAQEELGTATREETVNEALRLVAECHGDRQSATESRLGRDADEDGSTPR
ncbi:antitoxin YefM [Planomonospora sphaerica]|uniref:Antitoxin YefM n=1 Tax=Planomonospora sphaerica TaxID=161355 RepID=A0A161MFK4_9ACTN|nr:type II toxin-antitoxin system Phd/YefM family antitoxin [Planomonospora sphaerica]GAT71243.1 antitoxin YefM [Planomonospora sphaerica]